MAMSLEQIRHLADRVAASQGLEVVEIEYRGGSKQRVLRIFIEKNATERARLTAEHGANSSDGDREGSELPPAGADSSVALDQLAWVTHEDCERFSRDFGTVLDVEELVPGSAYTLEVSSPGLDRSLKSPRDYERFLKSMIKVQTFSPVAGNRHWQGRLVEVMADGVELDLAAGKQKGGKKGAAAVGHRLTMAFSNIERANLVPEF